MFDSKYYGTLSYKSRQLLEELRQLEAKEIAFETEFKFPEFDIVSYRSELVKQYASLYFSFIEESLKEAMELTEYKRNSKFFAQLSKAIATFSSNILAGIAINGYIGGVEQMRRWVGDMRDFIHGVNVARVNLGVDPHHGNKEKKAKFWRTHVWPVDSMYDKTINARLAAWDYAPYWELIENGNVGGDLAYPQFPATDFFANAVRQIEEDLTKWVNERKGIKEQGKEDKEAEQRILTIIEMAQQKLLDNPEGYKPGEVLAQFEKVRLQRTYELYVTQKRGQLGVRIKR